MSSEADSEPGSNEAENKDELETMIKRLKKIQNDLSSVANTEVVAEYQTKDIVQNLISDLSTDHDTEFLKDYYQVLDSNDETTIKRVTNELLAGVRRALRRRAAWPGPEAVPLGAWLCAAALLAAPAARALHALLAALPPAHAARLAAACARAAPPAALLDLADAARAPPAPPALADRLLRAAFHALAPAAPAAATAEPPSALELEAALDAAAGEPPRRQLLRVAERVLVAGRSDSLVASVARYVSAGSCGDRDERTQLSASVSTLRVLFGTSEIGPAAARRGRKRKPGSGGRPRRKRARR